ncbi:hypothetical protein F4775DRAFT_580550 [Biscogniauxia sp. FL1348]|nr:hypothetical protein F4775DRAFT_580550 [Biscogniauxia sp. FL1348]
MQDGMDGISLLFAINLGSIINVLPTYLTHPFSSPLSLPLVFFYPFFPPPLIRETYINTYTGHTYNPLPLPLPYFLFTFTLTLTLTLTPHPSLPISIYIYSLIYK